MQKAPRRHFRRVHPTRHLPRSHFSASRKHRHLISERSSRSFHLFIFRNIRNCVKHLRVSCLKRVRLCSTQDARVRVAPNKLHVLIKQHTRPLRKAGTNAEVHQQEFSPRKLPNKFVHPRHVLLLQPSHCPLLRASRPFVPAQSFFLWQLRKIRHHIRPSRVLIRNFHANGVINHLQHRVLCRLFPPQMDPSIRNRHLEGIPLTRVMIVDSRALDIQNDLVFQLKQL